MWTGCGSNLSTRGLGECPGVRLIVWRLVLMVVRPSGDYRPRLVRNSPFLYNYMCVDDPSSVSHTGWIITKTHPSRGGPKCLYTGLNIQIKFKRDTFFIIDDLRFSWGEVSQLEPVSYPAIAMIYAPILIRPIDTRQKRYLRIC